MKKLKTAVVGLGRIGWQFHLPGIREHEGFEATAVVDPLADRRDEAKKEFGARGYATLEDLFRAEQLDLVVIASPTTFHPDQAIAAMEHGIDVFCDKPIAPNLAEADRMIAAMGRTGRKLMMYQPHRVTPETQAARQIIDGGLIGSLYMIKMGIGWFVRRNDWQALRNNAGGMLNNYGAHFIDKMLFLTRGKAKRVCGQMRRIASRGDADDVVKAVIETESGVLLDLDIVMASAFPLNPCLLLGTRGSAQFDAEKKAFRVRYFKEEELSALDLNTALAAKGRLYDNQDQIPWRDEEVPVASFAPVRYYDFCYDHFALGKPPFVPIEETREVMRIMAECRASAGWDA